MATISHPAFRIMVEQFGGCDEYFNEMINAGSLLTGGPFEKYYIDRYLHAQTAEEMLTEYMSICARIKNGEDSEEISA